MLARRRLDALIDAATAPIVLVVAPPGFGKTTAVEGWLERRARRSVRLSIRPGTDESFWPRARSAVAAAVDGGGVGGGGETPGPPAPDPDAASGHPAGEILALLGRAGDRFVVVLDTVDTVDARRLRPSLLWMLERLPPGVTAIVIARSLAWWPAARWRAEGRTVVVDEHDQRFTETEQLELAAARFVDTTPAAHAQHHRAAARRRRRRG